jgi:hypothetical protein
VRVDALQLAGIGVIKGKNATLQLALRGIPVGKGYAYLTEKSQIITAAIRHSQ